MKIDRDTSITLPGDAKKRARTLESIEPSESLKAYLDELLDKVEDYGYPPDGRVFDAGNLVEGEPWVWTLTGRYTLKEHGWGILPLRFFETAERVMKVSAYMRGWNRGAIPDINGSVGALQQGSITLYWSSLVEEAESVAIEYEERACASVVRAVVDDILSDVIGVDPLCPACEEKDDGWEIIMEVAPSVDHAAINDALQMLWKPCDAHAADPEARHVFVGKQSWQLCDEGWVPKFRFDRKAEP